MFVYYVAKAGDGARGTTIEPEMESKGDWNFHLCHLANMLIFHPKMVEFLSHVSVVVDFPTKSKASW